MAPRLEDMVDETRVPEGGAVVTGTTGTVVVGGRDVGGGEPEVGRVVAGDVAMAVDPSADFVLTEPLGRVVPGLPGADVEELVAPDIDVAVAPPRDLAVEPAIDVVADRPCRTAFRPVDEPHADASMPAHITRTTRTVTRWA